MKLYICLYEGYKLYKTTLDTEKSLRYHFHDIFFYYENGWRFRFAENLKSKIPLINDYLECKLYKLCKEEHFYDIYLYVYDKEDKFYLYKRKDLLISALENSEIVIDEPFFKDKYVFIKGDEIFGDLDHVYVNFKKTKAEDRLKPCDRIDIYGLTAFCFKDFLLINRKCPRLRQAKPTFEKYSEKHLLIKSTYKTVPQRPQMIYEVQFNDYYRKIEEMPFFISSGQGIFISIGMCLIALTNAYISYGSGKSVVELILIVAMPLMMAIASIAFPLIQRKYKRRQDNYSRILHRKKETDIINDLEDQIRQDIDELQKCHEYYRFDYHRFKHLKDQRTLFQRGRNDADFLKLQIASGNVKTGIEIKYGSKEVNDKIERLCDKYAFVKDIPLIIDLKIDNYITIKTTSKNREEIFLYVLLQLVALHSYNDLKIAIAVDKDFIIKYPSLKTIKNLYDNEHRFIFIDGVLPVKCDQRIVYLSFFPCNGEEFADVCFIYFGVDDYLPKESKRIFSYVDNMILEHHQEDILKYRSPVFLFTDSMFYDLRKYHLDRKEQSLRSFSLRDFYGQSIDLNINYNKKKTGIICCLGSDDNNRFLEFDLSEGGIGPHGLIGGATGSGKSQFVISMILSLCLNYDCEKLNIAIIDFKGTGLEEALSYKGRRLPHVVLALNNLDLIELDRSLAYFRFECQRREECFAKLSKLTHKSIMSLDDYHECDPKAYGLPYLASQLIVIDEFAELKVFKNDFLKDIISIARIGRSLGMLLVLITQKPSSAIDQEIWANSSYKIALRMQDDIDSKELIKNELAAKIKRPGEYYLLHQDELFHGYSLYSRLPIDERLDQKVSLFNDDLRIVNTATLKIENEARQSSFYIERIVDHHDNLQIKTKSPYLERLKEMPYVELYKKYRKQLLAGSVLLGEYDDFMVMEQGALIHDIHNRPYVMIGYEDPQKRTEFFKLFLIGLLLHDERYDMIYIGENKSGLADFKEIVERVGYDDISDIEYVFYRLHTPLERKVIVFIEDYKKFIQNENLKALLENELFKIDDGKLCLVCAMTPKIILPFKLENIFTKYVLDHSQNDSLVYAFNINGKVSEEAVFLKRDHLVGFKMAGSCFVPNGLKKTTKFIKQIPDRIISEKDLLGYDTISREKVYIPKGNVLFCAYYSEVLKRYRTFFKSDNDYDFRVLNEIDRNVYYDVIVWIGPNIANQYLFVPLVKKDLEDTQAYIHSGRDFTVVKYG